MTALLDEEPSDAELADLMKSIDKDRSGTIEWEEFLEAMTNWCAALSAPLSFPPAWATCLNKLWGFAQAQARLQSKQDPQPAKPTPTPGCFHS